LGIALLMVGIAVIALGLRLIVLMYQEQNWEVDSATWARQAEQRLQIAEQWETYEHQQQVNEEASKPNKRQ